MEIQILRVGQFVILCVPGELTTMAGRRLREAMQAQVGGLNLQHSCDSPMRAHTGCIKQLGDDVIPEALLHGIVCKQQLRDDPYYIVLCSVSLVDFVVVRVVLRQFLQLLGWQPEQHDPKSVMCMMQVQPSWGNVTLVIAGLTNTYSSYVTTYEEYQAQRYEGASTIFGPHTLDAYIQVGYPQFDVVSHIT